MTGIVKIAIMALGGQGGGVLSGWLTALAQDHGWHVQTTSVAGVAQRTGATIYYTEMAPGDGPEPVMALAPSPGDVDIVIAAEAMEAGRAVMRGFVTPDRTLLIASTHRALATVEKTLPGDGRADAGEVGAAVAVAARQLVAFDMEALARDNASVISASLFGALAGSGGLPFKRCDYEAVIRSSGRGVDASLKAFAASFEAVSVPPLQAAAPEEKGGLQGPAHLVSEWHDLLKSIDSLPEPARMTARAGAMKTVDFQDLDYGRDYILRLHAFVEFDHADKDFRLTTLAAKHLANAMAYDDIIRVADRKTRAGRSDRIAREMKMQPAAVTEYFHPGAEEAVSLLPCALGERLMANAKAMIWLDWLINRGRHLRSDGIFGFAALYALSGLRRFRRGLFRHRREMAHLRRWQDLALSYAASNYDLACEIVECRRLIKGYAGTMSRSQGKFERVLSNLPHLDHRNDAALWLRRLRDAALQDPNGEALEGAIRTIRSFADVSGSTVSARE